MAISQELKDRIYIQEFSEEEIDEMFNQSFLLLKAGKIDEAMEIEMKIPRNVSLLNYLKKKYGIEYLIENNFNLAYAIKEYGYDWIKS